MRTPSAHQSTLRLWPRPSTISGARYSGVPQSVNVLPSPPLLFFKICGQTRAVSAPLGAHLPPCLLAAPPLHPSHLCEAKIDDLDVARPVDHEVLGLEVAVRDHFRVEVTEAHHG